jgi:hypothetical protein
MAGDRPSSSSRRKTSIEKMSSTISMPRSKRMIVFLLRLLTGSNGSCWNSRRNGDSTTPKSRPTAPTLRKRARSKPVERRKRARSSRVAPRRRMKAAQADAWSYVASIPTRSVQYTDSQMASIIIRSETSRSQVARDRLHASFHKLPLKVVAEFTFSVPSSRLADTPASVPFSRGPGSHQPRGGCSFLPILLADGSQTCCRSGRAA